MRGLGAGGPSMALGSVSLLRCIFLRAPQAAGPEKPSFATKGCCPLSPSISGLHPWGYSPLTRQVRADDVQAHGDCLVDFLRREESVSGPAFSWQHSLSLQLSLATIPSLG